MDPAPQRRNFRCGNRTFITAVRKDDVACIPTTVTFLHAPAALQHTLLLTRKRRSERRRRNFLPATRTWKGSGCLPLFGRATLCYTSHCSTAPRFVELIATPWGNAVWCIGVENYPSAAAGPVQQNPLVGQYYMHARTLTLTLPSLIVLSSHPSDPVHTVRPLFDTILSSLGKGTSHYKATAGALRSHGHACEKQHLNARTPGLNRNSSIHLPTWTTRSRPHSCILSRCLQARQIGLTSACLFQLS
jgi:hypothetical protein